MATAIALSGVIIESQNGSTMRYYKRCGSCGDTPNSVTTTSIPMVGTISTSSFRCDKCRRETKTEIKGI